jgi:hypothetical protein
VETKVKQGLTTEQLSSLTQLASSCEGLVAQLEKLRPIISTVASVQKVIVTGECQADIMATLRASQILKSCVDFMRPPKAEAEGIMKTINKLTQASKGPTGFELISYPMMRKQVFSLAYVSALFYILHLLLLFSFLSSHFPASFFTCCS